MRAIKPMIVGVAGLLGLACTDSGGVIIPPAADRAAPAGRLSRRPTAHIALPSRRTTHVGFPLVEMNELRDRIYLQHVVAGTLDATPKLELLARFVRRYTGMKVVIAEQTSISHLGLSGWQLTSRRLRAALAKRLPDDAFALLAITEADLLANQYTAVFGEASADQRVGVVSVARLHLSFSAHRQPSNPRIVLRRSVRLIAHELGHLFGLEHCDAKHCVMNHVATLRDLDNLPATMCSHGLAQLETTAGFDRARRRRQLAAFYAEHGL